jgi:hypothetical protein
MEEHRRIRCAPKPGSQVARASTLLEVVEQRSRSVSCVRFRATVGDDVVFVLPSVRPFDSVDDELNLRGLSLVSNGRPTVDKRALPPLYSDRCSLHCATTQPSTVRGHCFHPLHATGQIHCLNLQPAPT